MAVTDESIMVLLRDAIEEADSKDLRGLLEEAIKAPGPHHLVSDLAQADPRVHAVLMTNDGATFLPKRGFITEHSGLLHDLLADADREAVKDPVPLPNVAACELTRLLWLLRQGFIATQLERCIAAFDIEGVVALQEAANFMDVRCITVACGGAIAGFVLKAAGDEDRTRVLELVTPLRLPQELCELWLGRFGTKADELLKLLAQHPDQLLTPLAHWDSAWADEGRFSEHPFNMSNEKELTMLKARSEVAKDSHGASLMKLNLYSGTTDDGLVHVKELVQLTSLNLSGCKQITDAGLAHIKELKQLTSLDIGVGLGGGNRISDAGLTHIKELTQLTSLKLSDCSKITDVGLVHVMELKRLTSLDLEGCREITDSGLVHIKGLTHLTSLDLGRCFRITDTGLADLKELTQLTSLDLWSCWNITDTGLAHVKVLTHLQDLRLIGCYQITDSGLAHVKVLAQLTSLYLRGCKMFTDAGLAHVKELKRLTSLNLGGCWQITDESLMHIKELAQLQSLDLERCELITVEGGLFGSILAGHLDAYALARADVTWKLPDGTTLLHAAAQRNRREAIEALLKRGADVNAVDSQGRTPLQVAIEANATDAVRLLQQNGVQRTDSNNE